MSNTYQIHPAALTEYGAAMRYYWRKASAEVAAAFVREIETAIQSVVAAPELWPELHGSGVRRQMVRRFPYGVFYHWDAAGRHVIIYAIMHHSRRPGYWRGRMR